MNKIPRILVVDDERFHLNVIVDLLSEDHKVLVAKSGKQALKIAASEPLPDLILLDILMPGMDGYEVCKKLKADAKTCAIPIVFLTVKHDVTDETHGFSLGAVDYVTKPFSPPIVKARVAIHLALSKALRELASQNELLELKVDERTREIILAQQKSERLQLHLQQAQKMSAIGQFTGGIVHDFNSILSCVVGYTDLALENIASDKESELSGYLNHIHHAGKQAIELVKQLLAFSRGAPGKAQSIKLPLLVNGALKLLRPLLPSTIQLEVYLDDDAPAILIDEIHMHQIIMNLCINARDAMNGQGAMVITLQHGNTVKAECSACHDILNGDFVELVVVDDGAGMDAALIENIFEPFFSTKEVTKGTGMGLSVVNDIVHQHLGHIVVNTAPGRGTTFRLLFPPAPAAEVEMERSIFDGEENVSLTTIVGSHILLVDSDASVVFLLKELLEAAGYRVTISNDGVKALETIMLHPDMFDLLITDQTTSGMTGMALANAVLDNKINLPVILCSGSDLTNAVPGVAKVLVKPLQSEQLVQVIRELL